MSSRKIQSFKVTKKGEKQVNKNTKTNTAKRVVMLKVIEATKEDISFVDRMSSTAYSLVNISRRLNKDENKNLRFDFNAHQMFQFYKKFLLNNIPLKECVSENPVSEREDFFLLRRKVRNLKRGIDEIDSGDVLRETLSNSFLKYILLKYKPEMDKEYMTTVEIGNELTVISRRLNLGLYVDTFIKDCNSYDFYSKILDSEHLNRKRNSENNAVVYEEIRDTNIKIMRYVK